MNAWGWGSKETGPKLSWQAKTEGYWFGRKQGIVWIGNRICWSWKWKQRRKKALPYGESWAGCSGFLTWGVAMGPGPIPQGGPWSFAEEEGHRGTSGWKGSTQALPGSCELLLPAGPRDEHWAVQQALQGCHKCNTLSYVKMIARVWLICCTADAGHGTQGQCRPVVICLSTGQQNFVQIVTYKHMKFAAAQAEHINIQPLLLTCSLSYFILPSLPFFSYCCSLFLSLLNPSVILVQSGHLAQFWLVQ